jgi:hypothetical protein
MLNKHVMATMLKDNINYIVVGQVVRVIDDYLEIRTYDASVDDVILGVEYVFDSQDEKYEAEVQIFAVRT